MKSTTSIKSRLVNGLMLIVLFFLVQAGLVWYATSNAKSTVVESTRKNTIATSELGSLAVLAQQIRRYEKEYFVYVGNKEKRDAYEHEWRDALGKIEAALARMKTGSGGAFSGKDIEQVVAWDAASAFYAAEMNKIFLAVNQRAKGVQVDQESSVGAGSAGRTGAKAVAPVAPAEYRSTEVNDMIKAGKDRFSGDFIKGVATMDKAKTADTLALANVAEEMFDQVLIGVMITVAIGVVVALALSVSLPRAVTRTIAGLSSAAEKMSMGNLNQAYDSGSVVEFDTLAQALNRMRLGQQALVERLQKRQG
jgi:methyl-accepting chemotaxis protein